MNTPEAKLECGHRVRLSWNNRDSAEAYCRFDGFQPVEHVESREWHMICLDCTAGAWTGQLRLTAGRRASNHRRNRKGHRTVVVYDTVTKDGRGTERKSLEIPPPAPEPATLFDKAADEPPPF